MERGHELRVLDHGYVRLIDFMGRDEDIVEAARMSTGKGFVSWEPYEGHPNGDLGLMDFMYRKSHATPFEMCELVIEVQAPIFVFREWHRHRTQSYNEFSARYAQMPNVHYLPEAERIQLQSKTNKQGSDLPLAESTANSMRSQLQNEQETVYDTYERILEAGVAKEIARINTPVSRYSKMRAKTDLRNWLGFLKLRLEAGAQWEIRQFAQGVAEIVKALWPKTWEQFEEYDLYGARMSRTELKYIATIMLSRLSKDELASGAESALSKSKAREFLEKLGV